MSSAILKTLDFYLITKWGFDGSSGQSEYKQKFDNSAKSDASVFLSSLVPLQLISGKPEDKNQTIIWQNLKSSSTRFCRPIRFQFARETAELALQEKEFVEAQIQCLVPTKVKINDQRIEVHHKMLLTMVDGKICKSITETKYTQKCYLCGLIAKDFNNIEKALSTVVVKSRLQFGLSVLHAWIRFFECLIHISYKLPLKKWQVRGSINKQIVTKQKQKIQKDFKTQLGLLVDKPKPGYGSSNDGNTARRFFQNAEISASITGVDEDIIKRFKTILMTIASSYNINEESFQAYALETAKLFVKKYPWYPMPPTVHKILIHGAIIIENALLPIGQLSEEAQEASHKFFKKYRESHARKCSRQKTNEDIIHGLLLSSDPIISSMRVTKRKSTKLNDEVLQLLKAPDVFTSSTAEEDSISEDGLSSENDSTFSLSF